MLLASKNAVLLALFTMFKSTEFPWFSPQNQL